MARLNSLFTAFLTIAASTQKLGINLIRVAILVIFVWIGGLKFWNYEAEGLLGVALLLPLPAGEGKHPSGRGPAPEH